MEDHPRRYGAAALAKGVRTLYEMGQNDYALEPLVLTDDGGAPLGRISAGDAVIFCCRRGEREVQLTEAFTDPDFSPFPRPALPGLEFIILTLYHEKFKDLPVAFAPARLSGTLGETVAAAGLTQMRLAESEKFAHVTFFFSGGVSQPFPGEQQVRVPSPKGVPYDQVPELSLPQVVRELHRGLEAGVDLIVTNFANGDVIGHTSSNSAKVQCAALMDGQIHETVEAARRAGYVTFITADHGNLEVMTDENGAAHVAHTTNLVDFIVVDGQAKRPAQPADGILADVAPTVLAALGIDKPATMSGSDRVPGYDWGGRRKVLLLILDGWGIGRADESNPIHLAPTPHWDALLATMPHSRLQASGEAVGLKAGKAGNSEAGHMNLGAGSVVLQDDVRLDLALKDGSFAANPVFVEAMRRVAGEGKSLHLIGLLTEKSSHGSIDYPLALLEMAKAHGLERVFLHLIFDGRSTAPGSAPALLESLEGRMAAIGAGLVVGGVGRGIALDRDGNYDKTAKAFAAMVSGKGQAYTLD